MASNHFISDPATLSEASLALLPRIYANLMYDKANRAILTRNCVQPEAKWTDNTATGTLGVDVKVSIFAAGSAGHEPAFHGYVGTGLLDAAVVGHIFKAPSAEHIKHTLLHLVDGCKVDGSNSAGGVSRNTMSTGSTKVKSLWRKGDKSSEPFWKREFSLPIMRSNSLAGHERCKSAVNDSMANSGQYVRATQKGGIVGVVLNELSSVINVGIAMEGVKACTEDKLFHTVIVGDDVAFTRSVTCKTGRRGLAGAYLVIKVAGALAQRGASFHEVAHTASLVNENLITIGASLSFAHVPGQNSLHPSVFLNTDNPPEIYVGQGIENEAHASRIRASLPDLVGHMLHWLLDDSRENDRGYVSIDAEKDQVVTLINNNGGLSNLELNAIVMEVLDQLEEKWNIVPVRVMKGTYLSSLNGLGFSITILRIPTELKSKEYDVVSLLDESGQGEGTPSTKSLVEQQSQLHTLRGKYSLRERDYDKGKSEWKSNFEGEINDDKLVMGGFEIDVTEVRTALTRGLNRLIAAEAAITHFDRILGDGEQGIALKRSALAVLSLLDSMSRGRGIPEDSAKFVYEITKVVSNSMSETTGSLYVLYLNCLVTSLQKFGKSATSFEQRNRSASSSGSCNLAFQAIGSGQNLPSFGHPDYPWNPESRPHSESQDLGEMTSSVAMQFREEFGGAAVPSGSATPTSLSSIQNWTSALLDAVMRVKFYTSYATRDRTFLEPLEAWLNCFLKRKNVHEAVRAAQEAAEATRKVRLSIGYHDEFDGMSHDRIHQPVPDPGAYGIAQFLAGISGTLGVCDRRKSRLGKSGNSRSV